MAKAQDHGLDYSHIICKPGLVLSEVNQHTGRCRRVVDGKRCGKPFNGPKNRKYCDDCSPSVRYRGKA